MSRTEEREGLRSETSPATFEPIVPLHAAMDTDTALRAVHRELLRRILANQDGVRQARSGEFLHDFRVAVRRTRTGLSQLKHVYPRPEANAFAQEFKWVSASTSPARDLEVYLAAFASFRTDLGAETVAALEPVRQFLRDHQRGEHARCTEVLESQRYAALVRDWARFLEAPMASAGAPRDAARPIREVAATRIAAAYRRVVRRGEKLQPESPGSAFHRLRLDAKKLRYLLEFFGDLFDGEHGARALGALRRTQDALGAINDLRVQGEWLTLIPEPPGRAAGLLAAHMQARQQQERSAFLESFAAFVHHDSGAALRRFLGLD